MPEPTAQLDPDLDLLHQARGGDFAAFEHLVRRHQASVYRLGLRITGHVADAEDVVQETFLSAMEHLSDFAGRSLLSTWLLRIATHASLKILRKRKTQAQPVDPRDNPLSADGEPLPHPQFVAPWKERPEQLAMQSETRSLLEQAIHELEEKYRLIFLLRDVEHLSTEQAADILGITIANAKVRLMRARLLLRERLTRHFGDYERLMPHVHEDSVTNSSSGASKMQRSNA